jgi:hypothetical protein
MSNPTIQSSALSAQPLRYTSSVVALFTLLSEMVRLVRFFMSHSARATVGSDASVSMLSVRSSRCEFVERLKCYSLAKVRLTCY